MLAGLLYNHFLAKSPSSAHLTTVLCTTLAGTVIGGIVGLNSPH